MQTTTTLTITPAMRFAAQDWLHTNRGTEELRDALIAVRKATYAESFPGSYTDDMVQASQELLAMFPLSTIGAGFVVRVNRVRHAMETTRSGEGLR